MRRLLLIATTALAMAVPAFAQEPPPAPDRPLSDAGQEARAQALFDDIRCVVCQHEAIADSPAGIASDMRGLVRDQIADGASDQQIRSDLVRRYGDFVLFKPPVRGGTWLLWFGPSILLLLAGGLILLRGRRRQVEVVPLTPEENARLSDILNTEPIRRDPDAKPSNE